VFLRRGVISEEQVTPAEVDLDDQQASLVGLVQASVPNTVAVGPQRGHCVRRILDAPDGG
jgi:hypothetical protein